MLHKRVELWSDWVALVGQSCSRGEVRLTYADMCRRVDRLADGLRRLGVRSGDCVGILMDNRSGCEAMVGVLAIHRLRCVFVPLNARYAPAEVAYAIDKAECTAVIAASDRIAKLKTVRQNLPTLKHVVALDDADGLGPTYAEVIEAGDPDASAWPKVTPDDVVQSFFPCFVTAGPRCLVLPSWWAGGTSVMGPSMAVEDVLARLRRERSTIYYAVPSFFIFLLEAFDRGRHDLSSVRQFVYGGAAMSREVIGKLAQAFPRIRLMQTYGSTELGPSGTVLDPEHPLTRLGSIGRPMPSVEVALVDETGKPVPTGDVGEIAIKAPCVLERYYKDPENTAAAFRDGWFLSGDLGRADDDGFLYHVDRKKDMIIRGGHNIGSMEIENVLFQHPGVAEAAAVAVPHPRLGEDIHVFVVCRTGASPTDEELAAFCRERLADDKVPRRITFVDALPRNPMGKVLKTTLRQMAVETSDG